MMKTLSAIGEAIRHYKLNASGGYEEWSKVARAPDYRMHVPAMGFDVTGHDEVRDVMACHIKTHGRHMHPVVWCARNL